MEPKIGYIELRDVCHSSLSSLHIILPCLGSNMPTIYVGFPWPTYPMDRIGLKAWYGQAINFPSVWREQDCWQGGGWVGGEGELGKSQEVVSR